jgi:hypothetical protein
VDIGKNKDWSITDYEQMRQTTIDGKEYLTKITNMYYNNNKLIGTDKTLKIPITKNGEDYSINSLASEQNKVVLAAIDGMKNHTFHSGQLLWVVVEQASPILIIPY